MTVNASNYSGPDDTDFVREFGLAAEYDGPVYWEYLAPEDDDLDSEGDYEEFPEWVEEPKPVLIRCTICHGSGWEIVHGQETDCINCEGEGYLDVSVSDTETNR